jgi:hypothetical protein
MWWEVGGRALQCVLRDLKNSYLKRSSSFAVETINSSERQAEAMAPQQWGQKSSQAARAPGGLR